MKARMDRGSSTVAKEIPLSLLLDKMSIELLCLLKTGPSYPRQLAHLTGMLESHISERLGKLKAAGLLTDEWARIETVDGFKNVKQYHFNARNILLEFNPKGIQVRLKGYARESLDLAIPFYRSEIPKVPEFIGRERELQYLGGIKGAVVIWGIPGIGKTTIAAKFADDMLDNAPVFWHQIMQVDSLLYLIAKLAIFLNKLGHRRLLDAIDMKAMDKRALIDLAVSELSATRAVVVFDDFHRYGDKGIMDLLEAMANTDAITTLVTSRNRIPISHARELKINGLNDEDAAQLMKARGRPPSQELIRKLGGHPLLLDLASEFGDADVNDFIGETIFDKLHEEQLSTLLSISVYRGRITIPAVNAVNEGVKRGAVLNFLLSMDRLGVITMTGDEFELHPLIREAAYNMLSSSAELHRKAAGYYLGKRDTPDRIEALYHFIRANDSEMVIEMLKQYAYFIDEGYGNVLLNILQGAPTVGDGRMLCWISMVKGYAIRSLDGDLDLAKELLLNSLKYAEENGDCKVRAMALNSLGIIFKELGELQTAHSYYKQALDEPELEPLMVSRILYNTAEAYLEEGKLEQALDGMSKSMEIDAKYHDVRGYCVNRLNIDYISFLKGNFDAALHDLMEVRETLKGKGLRSLLGYCDLHIAYVLQAIEGKLNDAHHYLDMAIDSYRASGFLYMLAYASAERMILCTKEGLLKEAHVDQLEIANIIKGIKDKDVLGVFELAKAVLLTAEGKYVQSAENFSRAGKFLSRDRVSSTRALAWMGAMESMRGRPKEAYRYLSKARELLIEMGCAALAGRVTICMDNVDTRNWEVFCGQLI
ncbi:MAG: hypothetical protein M1388_04780 [Thaumarchaeota archaeon]|nr:hypothetical protein [Nitrososphaerota archaeon]